MTDRLGRGEAARPRPVPGDPTDPRGMVRAVDDYCADLRTHHYAERTVEGRQADLAALAAWLEERSVTRPAEVTRPMLQRYQRWLFLYRRPNGQPLSVRSQHHRLMVARQFFRWLARQNRILYNPAADLDLPRLGRRLPRWVLTHAEAERVLAQPDVSDPLGVRDRAILEVFYATGIRRFELARLSVYDLDAERGTLLVRQGKGRKDRIVPVGERAVLWVDKYLAEVRPLFAVEPDEGAVLFLGVDGESVGLHRLTELVREYVDAAAVGKRGSCHLFRHTMATAMLEGGADVRFVQEMLGHSLLETTTIYTKVSIRQLQRVYMASHPAALAERRRPAPLSGAPLPAAPLSAAGDGAATAALLAHLDDEATEEDSEGEGGAGEGIGEQLPALPDPGRFAGLDTVRRQRLPNSTAPLSKSGQWRRRQRAAATTAPPPRPAT